MRSRSKPSRPRGRREGPGTLLLFDSEARAAVAAVVAAFGPGCEVIAILPRIRRVSPHPPRCRVCGGVFSDNTPNDHDACWGTP